MRVTAARSSSCVARRRRRLFSKVACITLAVTSLMSWSCEHIAPSKAFSSQVSSPHTGTPEPVTVLVMSAGQRLEDLNSILEYYIFSVSVQVVPSVILVWNALTTLELPHAISSSPRLILFKEARNSLNNRYVHWEAITTKSVLLLDDDCIVRDLRTAMNVHLKYPDRITSFYVRSHKVANGTLAYVNPKRTHGKYSLGTGQASLLQSHWLRSFSTDVRIENIRNYIDTHRPTCEDIALHMYVSNITKKAPIWVHANQTTLKGAHSGMSADPGWGEKRTNCMQNFISSAFNGINPLVYSEFSHPFQLELLTD